MASSCRYLLALALALSLLGLCRGSYFLLNENKKCFKFEQPRDTPVVFSYEILDEAHEIDFYFYYGLEDKMTQQIMHKVLSKSTGHVDHTIDNDGDYLVCLRQTSETISKHPTRFKLSIDYGFDDEYYEKLSRDQSFDVLNMEVHKLNDLMMMTLNEADYQKHKEVDFHEETERMDTAALWWPMLQIGILVITGVCQVQHLKGFFKRHKLI